jgi:hypothetical protein
MLALFAVDSIEEGIDGIKRIEQQDLAVFGRGHQRQQDFFSRAAKGLAEGSDP